MHEALKESIYPAPTVYRDGSPIKLMQECSATFLSRDALCISQVGKETQRGQLSSQSWEGQGWDVNLGLARSGDHTLAISPLGPELLSLGLPQTPLSL